MAKQKRQYRELTGPYIPKNVSGKSEDDQMKYVKRKRYREIVALEEMLDEREAEIALLKAQVQLLKGQVVM